MDNPTIIHATPEVVARMLVEQMRIMFDQQLPVVPKINVDAGGVHVEGWMCDRSKTFEEWLHYHNSEAALKLIDYKPPEASNGQGK